MNPRFVPFMSKFYPSVIILLLFATAVSCTRNDAQREFEQEAYSAPNNYTETASTNGDILNNDPDDWRTSPRFQGFITVTPPYPNPVATNQNIQFQLDLFAQGSVNGLLVFVRLENGQLDEIYRDESPLSTSLNDFSISASLLSQFEGSSGTARGLKRVYFFDLNRRMISYGDILLE